MNDVSDSMLGVDSRANGGQAPSTVVKCYIEELGSHMAVIQIHVGLKNKPDLCVHKPKFLIGWKKGDQQLA